VTSATDGFCGAGGSSIGLAAAGFEVKLAANHWDRAIETHSANFPDTEHLCADLSNYDMRRLPRTTIAWFSPECTWHSPAGGRRRRKAQLDMFDDYVPNDAGDRSRMTMMDVIRATEVHCYKVVIVENVIEVAAWELFDWWLEGMTKLGYSTQIVCVSSAHIGGEGNAPAPQWRDRLYVVFTRRGVRAPDVTPRPAAWCFACGQVVEALQVWKRRDRRPIGKYGVQYVYRCPNRPCAHALVEPYVLPAAVAIDWSDVGQRIGDRDKPLAPATMRRIQAGLDLFGQPLTVAVGGGTFERESSGYQRVWPADDAPLRTRTATAGDALATPPFVVNLRHGIRDNGRQYDPAIRPLSPATTKIGDALVQPFLTMLRANNRATGANEEPMATLTTGRHHYLTVPPGSFVMKHHGGLDYKAIGHMTKDVSEPLPVVVAKPNLSLVIPYRRGNRARTTEEPLHSLSTHESAALCSLEVDVNDCHFRMLKPREHLRGQRFADSYVVTGNQGEQTMQAGNAVSSNVAQWLATAVMEVVA
jgi:DNA (cytosine-5)-methyltransferase 1